MISTHLYYQPCLQEVWLTKQSACAYVLRTIAKHSYWALHHLYHKFCSCDLRKMNSIFATLEKSGSLGRVWFRKGFWDCYRGRKSRSSEKNMEETNVSKLEVKLE